MELNTIIAGECSEVLSTFPDECIDLTVTSPPYDNLRKYNGFVFPFEAIAQQLYRVTKVGGIAVWIVADETKNFCESLTSFKQAIYFVETCGFKLLDTMIWEKTNFPPIYPSLRRYEHTFEYMFVFSKGRPNNVNLLRDRERSKATIVRLKYPTTFGGKEAKKNRKGIVDNGGIIPVPKSEKSLRKNIWVMPNGQIRGLNHSAPFPEKLAEDHILSWSNPGDVVLDPMCGSGTTLKMAAKNNRNYIGIDISTEYVELSKQRVLTIDK